MAAVGTERRFRVFRFKRGGRERYEWFLVPVGAHTTVLDALLWIRQHRDASLAVRHSCLHASCGTCGMLVDGREVLACVTPTAGLGDEIRVEPLTNVPVLADLVVDMGELYSRFPPQRPIVRTSGPAPEAERAEFARFEDCLECGLCVSACPVASTSRRFVGPAGLAAVQRMVEEPRGADVPALLEWAGGPDGAWRCHAAHECTAVCPAGLGPAEQIMALRGALLRRRARDGAPA